jgi:dTDP-4-dehydrorhamnose reductase
VSGPIALFGAGGQLGQETVRMAARRGVALQAFDRAGADILDRDAVRRVLDAAQPRLIVNTAAYTAVDKAESDYAAALAGNATGPALLAAEAEARGLPFVHFSTDYVFDGAKDGAYVEDDPVAPVGAYGRSKAEGEARVREACSRHVIIRTSWVYGVFGSNFLKTMLRLAREREELRVVADQRGCPTATADLAEAILAVDRACAKGAGCWGTWHFAGEGVTTWHGFATEIVAAAAPRLGKKPTVTPITTRDYPTPARRPANSELDSKLFAAIFGYRAQPWPERTRDVVRELLA